MRTKTTYKCLAILLALALCFGMLPVTALAAGTVRFNTPAPMTENGVTATVTFDKTSPQEEGTEVTATVTLRGKATEDGIHTICLFSETAEYWGEAQDVPVTAGQTDFPELHTYTFSVPDSAVEDLTLDHFFLVPQSYKLVLFEGKGYQNSSDGTEVTLSELGITATGDATNGYTYTFDAVRFVSTRDTGVFIQDKNATINLINSSEIRGGDNLPGATTGLQASGSLTVSGDGELSVSAGKAGYGSEGIQVMGALTVSGGTVMSFGGESKRWSFGIDVLGGDFTVNGGTVMGFGGAAGSNDGYSYDSVGIYAHQALAVTEGTVEGHGNDSQKGNSNGIYVKNDFTVNGGEIRGNGVSANVDSYGIYVHSGDFTVSDCTVEGNGGEARWYSFGICVEDGGDATVENSFVMGNGGEAGDCSMGIRVDDGNLTVSGGSTVEGNSADAEKNSVGISVWKLCTVNGGSVTGNAGNVTGNGGIDQNDSNGIFGGEFIVTNGSVTGNAGETQGKSETDSVGIFSNSNITLNGGSLTGNAVAAQMNSIGIYAVDDFTVNGGAAVGNGGVAERGSMGIFADNITVYHGRVAAASDEAGIGSVGINGFSSLTVLGGIVELRGNTMASAGWRVWTEDTVAPLAPKTQDASGANVMTVVAGANADGSEKSELTQWVGDGGDLVEAYRYLYLIAKDYTVYPVTVNGSYAATTGAGDYAEGETVTVDAGEYSGYTFSGWMSDDVEIMNADSTIATFTMPNQAVTVTATWTKNGRTNPFTDVKEGDWFYDYVLHIYENGLMVGTAADRFGPNVTTTRGMIVTILYSLEGKPAVSSPMSFKDVPSGAWYADAVRWAASVGIVSGYSAEAFGPEDKITREQMVAILYRYAQLKGTITEESRSLTGLFTDVNKISSYAVPAMTWAYYNGIISGKGNGLVDPLASATRAEVATILYRFCEVLN